jgi:hypothetical protein
LRHTKTHPKAGDSGTGDLSARTVSLRV